MSTSVTAWKEVAESYQLREIEDKQVIKDLREEITQKDEKMKNMAEEIQRLKQAYLQLAKKDELFPGKTEIHEVEGEETLRREKFWRSWEEKQVHYGELSQNKESEDFQNEPEVHESDQATFVEYESAHLFPPLNEDFNEDPYASESEDFQTVRFLDESDERARCIKHLCFSPIDEDYEKGVHDTCSPLFKVPQPMCRRDSTSSIASEFDHVGVRRPKRRRLLF